MTEPSPPLRRILIGAGCYADARDAVEIAEHLAAAMRLDLIGLMLDDPAAQETAVTPRQRVVTASGAMILALDRQQMRLVMASDARAFRLHLARIAEIHALPWSFEQQTGELLSGLCRAAQDWDLMMIGQRRSRRTGGPVLVVSGTTAPQNADEAALIDALATALQTRALHLRVGEPLETAMPDLLEKIARTGAALVVTHAGSGPFRTEDQLRQLVDAARCPVLVLGVAHIRDATTQPAHVPPTLRA